MSQNVGSSFVFNSYLEALKAGEGFAAGDYLGIAFINSDGAHVANPFTVTNENINTWTSTGTVPNVVYNTFVIPNVSIVNHYGSLDNTYFDAIICNSNTYSFTTPSTTFTAAGFILYKSSIALTAGNSLDDNCIPICFCMFETLETDNFFVHFTEAIDIEGTNKYIVLKYTPTMTEIRQIVTDDYWLVSTTSADNNPGYLSEKLVAGPNVQFNVHDNYIEISASSGSSGMVNPMTSAGQMIYGSTSGIPAAVNPPSKGEVLMGGSDQGVGYSAPEWRTASSAVRFGLTWSDKGSLIYSGDMSYHGYSAGTRSVEYLPIGTSGQVLTVGSSGIPEWSNVSSSSSPCMENYILNQSTSVESAGDYLGKIYCSRVVAKFGGTYTQLGFAIKRTVSGNIGKVGMAIYDTDGNLVGRTSLFSASTIPSGYVYWHDTESSFNLQSGNDYIFAIWFGNDPYSNTLKVFSYQTSATPDTTLAGAVIGQQSITEMPATLGSITGDTYMFYMAVR